MAVGPTNPDLSLFCRQAGCSLLTHSVSPREIAIGFGRKFSSLGSLPGLGAES